MGKRRRVAERRKTKQPAVLGGVIAVAVVGGALGAYSLYGSGASADEGTTATTRKAVKTGPLSAAEVSMASTAFLNAWQGGDVTAAAAATDDSAAATTTLTGFGKDAHVSDVTLTGGKRSGADVPFTVKAKVTYKGMTKPLSYTSKLTVVRGPRTAWRRSAGSRPWSTRTSRTATGW